MIRDIPDSFGSLLRLFRKRQHLTQQQIATALGVHRNTVGRWEEGNFLPESKALVLDLAKHLRLNEHEARQLLDASLIAPLHLWSVPYPRNPFFTGREDLLEVLHAKLDPSRKNTFPQAYALYGLGGIGKTQLALEYAYRHALEYHAVFWIVAETVEQIHTSMLRIAEQLHLSGYGETDQQRAVAAVVSWLGTHSEWLLICDNLENPDLLLHYLPANRQGALLLTTQRHAWGPLAEPLELSPLNNDEGMNLLLRRSRSREASAPESALQQPASQNDSVLADAAEIVRLLEGLPLALDQAGAYLEETRCSPSDYLQRYRGQRQQILSRRGTNDTTHPASVTTTLQLAIRKIGQSHSAAADLLRMCVFCYAEGIPEELFTLEVSHLGPELSSVTADPYQFDLTIAALGNASLLERRTQTRTFSVHRLVQAVLQDQMSPEEIRLWRERVIRVVNAAFPKPAHDTWSKCERYLAHALACMPLNEINSIDLPEISELLSKVGHYLLSRGRYAEASPLLESALSWEEQRYGHDHPALIPRLMNCAKLFWKKGNYKPAETLLRRILEIEAHLLEPDYPERAETLNNLALVYWQWGKYEQAESLFQQALRIRVQYLGLEHSDTASTLNNLALLYWKQQKYEQAEPLYQQALRIQEQLLGPEHDEVALVLNNLAALCQSQKKYELAESLFQRSWYIRKKQFGEDHLHSIHVLNNLAHVYRDQQKYEQAESLYQHVLSYREQYLPPDHPDLANTLVGLATLYLDQANDTKAEPLYQRALHIQEQRIGVEHLDIASTLHSLANLYRKQGKDEVAEQLYQRALRIQEQHLGPSYLNNSSSS